MTSPGPMLDLLDWRRRVATLYAGVRAERDPADGHRLWQRGRDQLLRDHPQSPLKPDDPMRTTGAPIWPYDPALRWELPVEPVEDGELRRVHSAKPSPVSVILASITSIWAISSKRYRRRRRTR